MSVVRATNVHALRLSDAVASCRASYQLQSSRIGSFVINLDGNICMEINLVDGAWCDRVRKRKRERKKAKGRL